jgi:hypothetical protein
MVATDLWLFVGGLFFESETNIWYVVSGGTGERWSCYAQLRPEMLPRKCEQEGDKTMTISSGLVGRCTGFSLARRVST